MFFGAFYAVGGSLILWLAYSSGYFYLAYPLIMGFALLAPFGAAGTYEISRRLEDGEPLSWTAVLGAVWNRSGRDLGWLALVSLFTFMIWMDVAVFLFLMFYGSGVSSLADLFTNIFTTAYGLTFLAGRQLRRGAHRARRLFLHRRLAAARGRPRHRLCDRHGDERSGGNGQSPHDARLGRGDRGGSHRLLRHLPPRASGALPDPRPHDLAPLPQADRLTRSGVGEGLRASGAARDKTAPLKAPDPMASIDLSRTSASPLRVGARPAVRAWLLVVAALVFAMVIVGGATRLTESGLSITQWKPVTGVIPPLSAADWQAEFDRYRQIPQFARLNPDMTVDGFKTIFWWEWGHRLLARIVGAAFILPALWFWMRGELKGALGREVAVATGLLALEPIVGWWMVSSGLSERTEVAQDRLALHLLIAAAVFGALIYAAAGLSERARARVPRGFVASAAVLAVLIYAQLGLGALVAGLRAGLIYNTWPLMGGSLVPGEAFPSPWARAMLDDPATAQFDHRMLAYAVFVFALFRCWRPCGRRRLSSRDGPPFWRAWRRCKRVSELQRSSSPRRSRSRSSTRRPRLFSSASRSGTGARRRSSAAGVEGRPRRYRKSILLASRWAPLAISPKPEFSLLSPANRETRAALRSDLRHESDEYQSLAMSCSCNG